MVWGVGGRGLCLRGGGGEWGSDSERDGVMGGVRGVGGGCQRGTHHLICIYRELPTYICRVTQRNVFFYIPDNTSRVTTELVTLSACRNIQTFQNLM